MNVSKSILFEKYEYMRYARKDVEIKRIYSWLKKILSVV